MDNLYIRWIGVPAAALGMVGIVVIAFLLHWLLGIVAFLFVGMCLESLLTYAYAKKPALRDAQKPLKQ